jgi:hypothetical protein
MDCRKENSSFRIFFFRNAAKISALCNDADGDHVESSVGNFINNYTSLYTVHIVLCVVMIIVIAIEPKAPGFKPPESDGILRAIKIRSWTSFGGDVNPSAPCLNTLRHVTIP